MYVVGNLLVYYQQGDASKSVSPDLMVVFGAPKHIRSSYRLWEEPKAPDFVLEIASESYGERVSTGFVESAINTVVGKRFGKRQQMQWSKPGAHLMLQARTRTLDGTLREKFEQWYPGLKDADRSAEAEPLAA